MNITYLELPTKDLQAQEEFYASVLGLPVNRSDSILYIKAGETDLAFTQADPDFDGAYHFAFNIPENQFQAGKEWLARRISLLKDTEGKDEFHSDNWNSKSVYFKDAAGNVLELIARHNLKNAMDGDFGGDQILNISEIGLPSENVIAIANDFCIKMGISVFKQEPSETFTPVGDDNGLLILPAKDRIWIPNSGVPAKLLPVKVNVEVNGKGWIISGYPYTIIG